MISTLSFEELVGKREKQIKALREGLKTFQLYDQIKEHAKFFNIYFVYPKHELCRTDLINFTELDEFKGKGYDNISKWLAQFLSELTEKETQMYLKFCTSYRNILLTEDINISVDFLNPDDGPFLKMAACTRKLRLPVVHDNYTEFKEEMMIDLRAISTVNICFVLF